jgi:hypothetical protein
MTVGSGQAVASVALPFTPSGGFMAVPGSNGAGSYLPATYYTTANNTKIVASQPWGIDGVSYEIANNSSPGNQNIVGGGLNGPFVLPDLPQENGDTIVYYAAGDVFDNTVTILGSCAFGYGASPASCGPADGTNESIPTNINGGPAAEADLSGFVPPFSIGGQ